LKSFVASLSWSIRGFSASRLLTNGATRSSEPSA